MNRDTFIETCCKSGYCSKEQAAKYAGDRQEFTEDDFIEAFRKYNEITAPGKWHKVSVDRGQHRIKTTYRAYGMSTNYWDDWG